jgi:hypothetical protein
VDAVFRIKQYGYIIILLVPHQSGIRNRNNNTDEDAEQKMRRVPEPLLLVLNLLLRRLVIFCLVLLGLDSIHEYKKKSEGIVMLLWVIWSIAEVGNNKQLIYLSILMLLLLLCLLCLMLLVVVNTLLIFSCRSRVACVA